MSDTFSVPIRGKPTNVVIDSPDDKDKGATNLTGGDIEFVLKFHPNRGEWATI